MVVLSIEIRDVDTVVRELVPGLLPVSCYIHGGWVSTSGRCRRRRAGLTRTLIGAHDIPLSYFILLLGCFPAALSLIPPSHFSTSMANVASMGPPPSPKEPRRSGRRSGPSTSTSKSPAGSPTSETAPKPKDNTQKPPLPSTSTSNRTKRAKNEDADDAPEESHKNGVNGTSNARSRRKGTNNRHGRPTC